MTAEEAAGLKPGDRVEVRIRQDGEWFWCPAEVVSLWEWSGALRVYLKRFRAGKKATSIFRRVWLASAAAGGGSDDLRLGPPDHSGHHVIADWLEERGYLDAAAALRREFPMGPAAEP